MFLKNPQSHIIITQKQLRMTVLEIQQISFSVEHFPISFITSHDI